MEQTQNKAQIIASILAKWDLVPTHYKLDVDFNKCAHFIYNRYELSCALRNKLVEDVEQVKDAIRKVTKYLTSEDTKPWLLMLGNVGTGKSTLARAMEAAITAAGCKKTCQSANAVDLALLAQSEEEDSIYKRLKVTADYAIIDDLGQEATEVKSFGNSRLPFIDLAAKRYDLNKPLIVTSNLDLSHIEERYGERTADRIAEMAEIINFNGKSHRI